MHEKSVLGLSPKFASVLAYAGLFVSGILILAFERDNKIVRFHAMQSTIFSVLYLAAMSIIISLLGWIFIIGDLVGFALSSLFVLSWLFLIYKAVIGEAYKLPVVGDAAWKQVNK